MKLSDAILKGCEMVPTQAHKMWWADDGENGNGQIHHFQSACAIGAAAIAQVGLGGVHEDYMKAVRHWLSTCPGLAGEVTNRNDDGESRESIAAWLAERGL